MPQSSMPIPTHRTSAIRPSAHASRRVRPNRTAAVAWLVATPLFAQAADWTSWRGAGGNGVSTETGLPEKWSQAGENLVWHNPDVQARCTPIIMNGRVFLTSTSGEGILEQERIACLDADTGKLLWEYRVPVFHTTIPATRVGWTSCTGDPETGNIYAHTTGGLFICLSPDGRRVWEHSLTEEYYRISGYGGRIVTPVIDGDLVIVSFLNASWGDQARGGGRFLACDKRTGQVVWWSNPAGPPVDTNYSVPVVAEVNGVRLLIGGCADGSLAAIKVGTGEPVWTYKVCKTAVHVSPVVAGSRVYVSHSEENLDDTMMGAVLCIDATGTGDVTKTKTVWKRVGVDAGYASPALHDGRLYVIENGGHLHCLNAENGETLWRHRIGRVGKGSPVWADGKIYATEVNARFVILKPGDKDCQTLDEETFVDPNGLVIDTYGSPAIANGRVYFATQGAGVWCFGSKDPRKTPDPPFTKPAAAPPDAPPAHLAVFPADVLLRPGERQVFAARAFDAGGRLIGNVQVVWSGPGMTDGAPATDEFELKTKAAGPGFARTITATYQNLTATTRVRCTPNPPYEESFDNVEPGRAPAWWIGAMPKFQVARVGEQLVLRKTADDPRFSRADIYIGHPSQGGYTIQVDLCGAQKGHNLPDMGVNINRYRVEIMGNTQKLRIVSWIPTPRIEAAMPFAWKAGEWFTMKARVDAQGEKAVVRGKVWKRGETEPADWTVTLEDPIGQLEGAPGLYAYSLAEIYYDNLKITPNGP